MFLRLGILLTLHEIAHLEAVPCFGDQLANATPKLKGAQALAKALWNENHFNLISSLKSGSPHKFLVAYFIYRRAAVNAICHFKL